MGAGSPQQAEPEKAAAAASQLKLSCTAQCSPHPPGAQLGVPPPSRDLTVERHQGALQGAPWRGSSYPTPVAPPRGTHSPPLPALHFPLQSPPALHPPKIHQGHQNHRSGAPSHGPMPLPPGVADPEMLETSNREPRPSVNSPQHHKSKLKPICSPRAQPRDLPTSLGMRQAQGQPGNPTKVRSWITKV